MQDYGRALIVGDTSSHGKGTVQQIIDLTGESPIKLGALKLTIQQFFRVNGDSTQVRGVLSDIVIPSLSEHVATGEKDIDFALPFAKVEPAKYAKLDMVPAAVKHELQERSAKRIKESKDFAKLAKEIEHFKQRKANKTLPLNEKVLRAQFTKEDVEKLDTNVNDPDPDMTEKGVYKFKRNFTNDEILKITEDLVQGKKLVVQP